MSLAEEITSKLSNGMYRLNDAELEFLTFLPNFRKLLKTEEVFSAIIESSGPFLITDVPPPDDVTCPSTPVWLYMNALERKGWSPAKPAVSYSGRRNYKDDIILDVDSKTDFNVWGAVFCIEGMERLGKLRPIWIMRVIDAIEKQTDIDPYLQNFIDRFLNSIRVS